MREPPEWRHACVVRAQTIAAGLRMVEFAVEGGLPAFGQGARTRVLAAEPGFAAICSYVCVNVGQGRMRVLVAGGSDAGGSGGARFMWSLVEGARVRLTLPQTPASRTPAPPRIAGETGLRLDFSRTCLREAAEPGFVTIAVNGNAAAPRRGPARGREGRPDAG